MYIGNLGNNASKYDLEDACTKYGPLRDVWVARNPPGFAFVEFEDNRDAKDAVRGLDGTRLCGVSTRMGFCLQINAPKNICRICSIIILLRVSRTVSASRCRPERAGAGAGTVTAAVAAAAEEADVADAVGPGPGRAAEAGAATAGAAGAARRHTTGPSPGADPGKTNAKNPGTSLNGWATLRRYIFSIYLR